jgi:hypothetical protein
MFKRTLLLLLTALLLPIAAQPASPDHFNGQTWWDHVKVLAADNMEGRETGSEGLRKAEAYVVEQLKKSGVQPAGKDGYYQPVKLVSRQIVEADSSAALIRDGKSEPLTIGDDFIFNTRIDLAPEVERAIRRNYSRAHGFGRQRPTAP